MNSVCYENAGPRSVRCSWPPDPSPPGARHDNWFEARNCTWWAADRTNQHIGWYPGWSGDAGAWATNAKAAGWLVRPEPMARSIVVIPPYTTYDEYSSPYAVGIKGLNSGSFGHVAFAEHVEYDASGAWIYVSEMNRDNNGGFDYAWMHHQWPFQYILVP
jgi:surface antigen